MEVVKGNLLTGLTVLSVIISVWVWAYISDGPFEWKFSFCREKNRKKELRLAGKVAGGISVIGYALYGVGVYLLKIPVLPIWNLAILILAILFALFAISGIRVKQDIGKMAWGILLLFEAAPIVILCMPLGRVNLDQYCGYASAVMVVADIFAYAYEKKAWMKGDL